MESRAARCRGSERRQVAGRLDRRQAATVILYDEQVPGEVLELARREARRIPIGESGAKTVELARAGETVARVTCRDAAEEIAAARAAGVEVLVSARVSAASQPR